MKLVIVESPTKAKTITKFLGDDFEVLSSYGHVRDLPKGKLGVDVEHNFEPQYVIPTKARKKVTALKKEAKKADEIILATDEDREGEAIAWHLIKALGLDEIKTKNEKLKVERIAFHEITKSAIESALTHPRDINMKLVNAQQARRVLDRLVGYKLSPFLWKKIIRGLSAGRVQSVALRLIVEREREIQKFKPDEYWSIEALLQSNSKFLPAGRHGEIKNSKFSAYLYAHDGKPLDKLAIKNKTEAAQILGALENSDWLVEKIDKKQRKRNPLPPFTTSTMQRAAFGRFGYTAKRTMMLAQNLYERGLITYHRTDSLNLSQNAVAEARKYIEKEFGKKYVPEKARLYKARSKGAQEAHEAIRPTNAAGKHPDKIKLEGPQKKLYTLIWQRFVGSQMNPALFDSEAIDIKAGKYTFRANGHVMKFDGFLKVYSIKFEEAELPPMRQGEKLTLEDLKKEQHFTKPPARYSEASLVKALEKHGIGRPSTYASIISTIQTRNYVSRNDQKRLEPNEIGFTVNDLLVEHFPKIVDIDFTAKMEKELDEIAHGKEGWQEMISEFYKPFEKNLEEKYEEVEKKKTTEETDKVCPECGKKMLKRMGRFGDFYGCSGFPDCKHTETIQTEEGKKLAKIHCPKCAAGHLVEKKTKRGKMFYGCSRYPDCDFASWDKPHLEQVKGSEKKRVAKCPECERALVEKETKKKGKFIKCNNKECDYERKM